MLSSILLITTSNMTWIILCLVLLIMFITLSIYQRLASRQLKENFLQQLKQQNDNNSIPDNLNKWLNELSTAKQLVQHDREILSKRKRNEFDKQFYERMLHFNNFPAFRHMINHRLNDFSTRIEVRFPHLSEKELTLLYLVVLQIPNEDILLLTNYAPTSLPTTKQRLCKKVGISHVNDLFPYLVSWI